MSLYSRYVQLEEFEKLALQIKNTEGVILVKEVLFKRGLVRASFKDNICYSLQGVYAISDKVGDAWMISDHDLLKSFPITPHRSAKTVIAYAFKEFDFNVIGIQVPNDFHVMWCESMGFKRLSDSGDKVVLTIKK